MSNNNKYTSSTAASTTKSCYRLYAGHGNWINLNAKTTQDLLQIFQKGVPCRYPLAEGLAIDIIPNDVDCNSKNIDMFGLMRADLVYESQADEGHVQQLMSHYIRMLLDEQGIIDAFPPLRTGEDLPIVTSIPTHRHLSLVPSVIGAVRRGPKPSSYNNKKNNASSSSSSAVAAEDSLVSSSISSSTASSPSSSRINNSRKRSNYAIATRRSTVNSNKRGRNTKMIESVNNTAKGHQQSDLNLPNEVNQVQLFDHSQSHYLAMNNNSANHHQAPAPAPAAGEAYHHHYGANPMLPISYTHQGQHAESPIWMPFQQQQQQQNSSATRSTAFNFEFNMDFDHHQQQQQQNQQQQQQERQSPTDILHEYEFSQRGFDGGELYPSSILEESHLPPSSDSTTDSYVPTSPWHHQQQQQQRSSVDWEYDDGKKSKTTNESSTMDSSPATADNTTTTTHFFKDNNKDMIDSAGSVTTLPMDRLLLSNTTSNNSSNHNNGGNLILSHVGGESS